MDICALKCHNAHKMLLLKVEGRVACYAGSVHNTAGEGLTPSTAENFIFLNFHSELGVPSNWQRESWKTVTSKISVWLPSELCDDHPAGRSLESQVTIFIVVTAVHTSSNIYIKDQLPQALPNPQTHPSLHSQQV